MDDIPSPSHLPEDTNSDLSELSSSNDLDPSNPSPSSPEEPGTAEPQSSKPKIRNFQPSVRYLNRLGIKVRDYAFESTLPPVPTFYFQKRQVQPSVNRPLRRQSTEPDDGSQPQSQGTQVLERRPTEPVDTPEQSIRMRAFDNLEDYDDINVKSQQPFVDEDPFSTSQGSTHISGTHNSTSFLTVPSNITEGQDTSNIGIPSTPQRGGPSQASVSESLPHVEPLRHPIPSSVYGMLSISFPSSPLTPLPSSPTASPLTRVTPLSSQLSSTIRSNSAYDLRTPGAPRASPRYFLRKRPSPSSSSSTSPSRPSKRIRLLVSSEPTLRATKSTATNSSSRSKTKKKTRSKDTARSSSSRSVRVDEPKAKGKKKKY